MTGFGSSCGACKFLRRKCTSDCVFAPYFSYDQASTHFAAVHKIYGASNVSKLLSHLPIHNRSDAAITISYEALARMQDPISVSYTHLRAHETSLHHVCRLLLEKMVPMTSLMTVPTICAMEWITNIITMFFNDTATTEIYTRSIVGSVRCV